jgi:hypothetical protein
MRCRTLRNKTGTTHNRNRWSEGIVANFTETRYYVGMADTKRKNGRPTKFDAKMVERIKLLALRGYTDVEMCKILDVSEASLNNWKQKNAGFLESLKDWKSVADGEVEASLFHRAKGYSHPEDKIFNDNGAPLVVPTTKHYPPDSTAAIFWLKNRRPQDWRDRVEVEHSGSVVTEIELRVVDTK